MDSHGLKVIKNMCYKKPSCLIHLQLNKHATCFENLDIQRKLGEWGFHQDEEIKTVV